MATSRAAEKQKDRLFRYVPSINRPPLAGFATNPLGLLVAFALATLFLMRLTRRFRFCKLGQVILAVTFGLHFGARGEMKVPGLEEALKAGVDSWGEAAMRQPNGASYEFFEKLLPPPRYVNADFHFYPIVLSAPNAK